MLLEYIFTFVGLLILIGIFYFLFKNCLLRKKIKKIEDILPSVLIVEDDINNAEFLKTILCNEKCEVDVATSGEDAIRFCKNRDFSVILMDINLGPGMNGIDAANEIKKLSNCKNTFIVALTSYEPKDVVKEFSKSFSHYIQKPYDKEYIKELVHGLVMLNPSYNIKNIQKKQPIKKNSPCVLKYAAISFISLIIITSVVLIDSNRYSSKKVFEKYYTHDDIVGITRGYNSPLIDAIIKFDKGDYQGASELFNNILNNDTSNMAIFYYYGIANIETQNYKQAIKSFQEIIDNNNNLYIEYAQWYLSLIYLITNEKNKACYQINEIVADTNHYYNKMAMDLLEDIKKIK